MLVICTHRPQNQQNLPAVNVIEAKEKLKEEEYNEKIVLKDRITERTILMSY